jgi:nicotinamide mononucleotide transporter
LITFLYCKINQNNVLIILFCYIYLMDFYNYLIQPYTSYTNFQILLESIAAMTGIISVYFSIKKNILVYPIGIISTVLYTYLLYQWGLFGDMAINGYYTIMSVYGWYNWAVTSQKSQVASHSQLITSNSILTSHISILIISFLLVLSIYYFKFGSLLFIPIINYFDSVMTAVFLLAMYLMAQKNIENWIFWMIGNCIAIPLFIIKGYGITSIQYLVFLVMAVIGYREWRKEIQ